jgi:DNA ligase-associated metallophosphoesterase
MSPFTDHPAISLLPEGGAFISDSRTLVVADVHLGKSAAFRARGLPVPEGDTARDLARLTALAEKCAAANLVIAGDLFHAPSGITAELEHALERFLTTIAMPVTLVAGNHDTKLKRIPAGLRSVPHLGLGETIRILHDPAHATGDRLHISGHWHPVVRIPDGRRTSLRLPCFLFRNNTLVLPAFGSFTGGAVMATQPGDRVFVALRENVVELPVELIS